MIKNWRTLLAGLAAAGLNLFANGATWKEILLSLALAAAGAFAKDQQVTGGTVPATVEAEARVKSPKV